MTGPMFICHSGGANPEIGSIMQYVANWLSKDAVRSILKGCSVMSRKMRRGMPISVGTGHGTPLVKAGWSSGMSMVERGLNELRHEPPPALVAFTILSSACNIKNT